MVMIISKQISNFLGAAPIKSLSPCRTSFTAATRSEDKDTFYRSEENKWDKTFGNWDNTSKEMKDKDAKGKNNAVRNFIYHNKGIFHDIKDENDMKNVKDVVNKALSASDQGDPEGVNKNCAAVADNLMYIKNAEDRKDLCKTIYANLNPEHKESNNNACETITQNLLQNVQKDEILDVLSHIIKDDAVSANYAYGRLVRIIPRLNNGDDKIEAFNKIKAEINPDDHSTANHSLAFCMQVVESLPEEHQVEAYMSVINGANPKDMSNGIHNLIDQAYYTLTLGKLKPGIVDKIAERLEKEPPKNEQMKELVEAYRLYRDTHKKS